MSTPPPPENVLTLLPRKFLKPPPSENFSNPPNFFQPHPPEKFLIPPKISQPPHENYSTPFENILTPKNMLTDNNPPPPPRIPFHFFFHFLSTSFPSLFKKI